MITGTNFLGLTSGTRGVDVEAARARYANPGASLPNAPTPGLQYNGSNPAGINDVNMETIRTAGALGTINGNRLSGLNDKTADGLGKFAGQDVALAGPGPDALKAKMKLARFDREAEGLNPTNTTNNERTQLDEILAA